MGNSACFEVQWFLGWYRLQQFTNVSKTNSKINTAKKNMYNVHMPLHLAKSAMCFICFHVPVGLHIYIYALRSNKLDYYDKLSSNPCCSSHLPGKPGGEGHQPASSSSSATESNGSWAAGKSQGMGVLYRINPEDHGHKRNQHNHFLEELWKQIYCHVHFIKSMTICAHSHGAKTCFYSNKCAIFLQGHIARGQVPPASGLPTQHWQDLPNRKKQIHTVGEKVLQTTWDAWLG